MVVTAISCDFDVAGGRDIQRVWAAFLVMFKVNAAWVPSTLVGVAPLLDSNGSVTALQWRLLHDGLTLNEASLPARHGAARNCGMTRTGEIHNSGGEGTNGLGSCRLRSAGNHCSAMTGRLVRRNKDGRSTRTYRTGAAMTEAVLKTKAARRSLETKEIILTRKNDLSIDMVYQLRCDSRLVKND